mmetsp:Transcript_13123/g.2003  ORF Transcript_13123/g.2003 Transcript_13123/m.2003 type:complete len:88 (+) Transcript_13123:79-342(+)
MIIIFFRVINYLGTFERVRLLHDTFKEAKDEIFYFFVLLIGIFMAFVIFGHVAFGSLIEDFSTVPDAIATCLIIIFGDVSVILTLLE